MPVGDVYPWFYHHLFRTKIYLQQFKQRSRGIMDMRLRLYFEQLGQIPIVVPPLAEQQAIVAFYNGNTAELTRTIETTLREIALIREYCTRLVADVVTGNLDIRAAAARLPDEPGAAESVEEPIAPIDEDALENVEDAAEELADVEA